MRMEIYIFSRWMHPSSFVAWFCCYVQPSSLGHGASCSPSRQTSPWPSSCALLALACHAPHTPPWFGHSSLAWSLKWVSLGFSHSYPFQMPTTRLPSQLLLPCPPLVFHHCFYSAEDRFVWRWLSHGKALVFFSLIDPSLDCSPPFVRSQLVSCIWNMSCQGMHS